MERAGDRAAELQEPLGGGSVRRLGGDRVDQIPEMDGERGARRVDGCERVARAGVGERRARERRRRNPFRFVDVGVGDHGEGEKTLPLDPRRSRGRAGNRRCYAGASRFDRRSLEHTPTRLDQFDGGNSACPGRRGAKRDAGPSGGCRNEPGEPICPTEGRVQLLRGVARASLPTADIAMRSALRPDRGRSKSLKRDPPTT